MFSVDLDGLANQRLRQIRTLRGRGQRDFGLFASLVSDNEALRCLVEGLERAFGRDGFAATGVCDSSADREDRDDAEELLHGYFILGFLNAPVYAGAQ